MENEYDFKSDIQIDDSILDKEWILQPKLYMKWLEYEAICSNKVDKLKSELELLEATLYKFILSNNEKKPTEKAIEMEIISNPGYQELNNKLIESRFELKIASGAVSAFDHKKKALERLVDLYITGYNAEPRQNIKNKIIDSVQDKIRSKI
jgi:hypothetical protein